MRATSAQLSNFYDILGTLYERLIEAIDVHTYAGFYRQVREVLHTEAEGRGLSPFCVRQLLYTPSIPKYIEESEWCLVPVSRWGSRYTQNSIKAFSDFTGCKPPDPPDYAHLDQMREEAKAALACFCSIPAAQRNAYIQDHEYYFANFEWLYDRRKPGRYTSSVERKLQPLLSFLVLYKTTVKE